MSRASQEVGPGPGARRVSPSLDPGLREGRVAESGPGPGPRATLAGGGAGGACRRRPSGDGSAGGGAEAGLRGQGSRARGCEPTRGPGPAPSRVGELERQSPARLSSLGDLGLTKPRGEWGAGRRWTLGRRFLQGPIPRLRARATPWEVLRFPLAQGQRCIRDTKVRNDASPFLSLQGHREGPVVRGSRSFSFPAGEARDQVSSPLHGARLKSSLRALQPRGRDPEEPGGQKRPDTAPTVP